MPKVDFFALSCPETVTQTKTFTDPRLKDAHGQPRPITLALHALDPLELGAMQNLAMKKAYEYREVPQDENGEEIEDIDTAAPAKALMVGGERVVLNDHLTMQLASLVLMQCGDKADCYTFEDFAALCVNCPTAWKQIISWRNGVIGNKAKTVKTATKTGETEAAGMDAPEGGE